MKCSFCQANLEPGTAFCPNCGAAVVPSSAGAKTTLIKDPNSNDSPTVAIPPQSASSQSTFSLPSQQPVVTQPYQPPGLNQPYQPPSAPYSYGGADTAPATLPNSTAAIVSLVFGIVAWTVVPFLGAIVAVIAGHIGRREVAQSNGRLGGGGFALAGLIMGYLQLALFAMAICFIIAAVLLGVSTSP
ncbi:MAG: hypothetical protein OHK0022_43780 [Roseiflexaceae bacterium]